MDFQLQRVRASFRLSAEFALSRVNSPGFGSSAHYYDRPIQTRFRYGSGTECLNLNAVYENSPAHSSIGTKLPRPLDKEFLIDLITNF